ncbi:hypothetical protein PHYC_00647 [Phycisphaerales bacterium]|nr:hypothetical protein PHYC_00647 [Phycisphaerales bacterium]
MNSSNHFHWSRRPFGLLALSCAAGAALGQVATTPTMNTDALALALNPVGLSITAVSIHNGVSGQFGTFTNFELLPVTIRPGIVLSSGDVTDLTPIPGAGDPGYDPASPPAKVNNQMNPEPVRGHTPEFDAFGFTAGNIENFQGCYDVAALRIDFTLDNPSPIKFDFLFGSVEYPFWTSQFTDSFLVFLDGTTPSNQITLDFAGNAVQVGSSFAGLETTGDMNSAFSNPHGVIHHLTTTSPMLADGEHFLIFEIGDVNDHILDSAVFISNLRAEPGPEGTHETEDPPYVNCPHLNVQPVNTAACAESAASFSVSATGIPPLTYRWQIRTAPETWANLTTTPLALPCGGWAQASTPDAAATQITISPCAGVSTYRVRCRVANDCGDLNTNHVTLTILPDWDPACGGSGCDPDVNCDGSINGFDIEATEQAVNGDFSNFCQASADLNSDGAENGFDIETEEQRVNGAPC